VDWTTICRSPLPGGVVMRDVAAEAAQRVADLDKAMSHPALQVALAKIDNEALVARAGMAVTQPATDDATHARLAKARADMSARRLLVPILRMARERWRTAAQMKRQLPPEAQLKGSQQVASASMRVGQITAELAALPGWQELQGFLAGVTWGFWFAASETQGEAHDAHVAVVEMLVGLFAQLQGQVDLGIVAETWLKAQSEERGKE